MLPGVDFHTSTDLLSTEQRKIVEIIRAVYRKPELLVVRELGNILSGAMFLKLVEIFKMLNEAGTVVLYLTSQWEEAIRLKSDIDVVIDGRITEHFTAEDVKTDPSRIYYASMNEGIHLNDNKKFADELAFFQYMKQNVWRESYSKNATKMIESFTNYLLNDLRAQSVVTYIIDNVQGKCVNMVAVGKKTDMDQVPPLSLDKFHAVLSSSGAVWMNNGDHTGENDTEIADGKASELCCAISVSAEAALIVHVFYEKNVEKIEHDKLMIEWIAKEIALVMENQKLLGSSLLLKESHHRIKNNLQVIVSLLEMEEMLMTDHAEVTDKFDGVESAFDSAINRVKCIASVHDMLAQKDENVNILDIRGIVVRISEFYRSCAKINMEFDLILIPYTKAVSVALVINEIINNSVKHNLLTNKNLQIDISAKQMEDKRTVIIKCHDNGIGFRDQKQQKHGVGLGKIIIESVIVDELNGTVQMFNQDGATVEITIPMQALLPVGIC